jgi:hypothetical protein
MISQALALDPALAAAQVTLAMTQVDRVWQQLFLAEQQRLVRLLVERVIVTPTNLKLRFASAVSGASPPVPSRLSRRSHEGPDADGDRPGE